MKKTGIIQWIIWDVLPLTALFIVLVYLLIDKGYFL